MRHFIKYSVSALSVALLCAGAPAIAKEAPPEPATPRNFTLPKMDTYTLDNGVKVTLVPYGRVPKATVRAVVNAGNLNDGDQVWISDLTASMMEEGAGGLSASDMAVKASEMGGNLNIGVGLNQTFAVMDVLSESAPDAVGMLADVLQRPNLPEGEFDRVKSGMVRDLSVGLSRPQSMADAKFAELLYPDHPYGRFYPEEEALKGYTLEDVKAYHASNFGGARTHIYVVGQFDAGAVKNAIKSQFGDWAEGPGTLVLPANDGAAPKMVLIDREGAPQSTLRLGKRVPPVDGTVELDAMNTLLGGYFSSRITQNIREDKGYTYSPNASFRNRLGARNWQQNADVTSESTGPALTEILNEIDRMRTEEPSADEVQGIKNYMNGIFVIRLASRGGVANPLATANLHGLGAKYLENYVGKVQALTGADFQDAASEYLNPEEMTLVVVGPLDQVRPQIEAIKDRLPPE